MTSSILIDTNILVRHFIRDVMPQAQDSTRFLEEFSESAIRGKVPGTVVLELVFTLERQYNVDRNSVADALVELVQFSGVDVENADAVANSLIEYRHRRSISFADAYHCELAKQQCDGKIASYDRALSRVPGITRIEPNSATE